ncbi:disintegrin and metalloproteinase domain-containing protein 10-like [Diadema setosum]|uniref:disintegrin and metalloproteinase domain-containing protein 10-like n=1 Tax=Diadema setosum TaxID=31175 RepID=UPI003B3BC6EA
MITRIILLLALLAGALNAERLNRYVHHYELLNYNTDDLHSSHERARRSVDSATVELDFTAHGRQFNLRLHQGSPHISQDLILETDEGASQYQPDFLYIGKLKDKPSSKVHGGITGGVFQGVIYDEGEEYHIEKAKHHFRDTPIPDASAHSVIYKASDVTHPEDAGCGLRDRVASWMSKIQNSADDVTRQKRDVGTAWKNMPHAASENKYAAQHRSRRAPFSSTRTACSLYLQADHTYTRHYEGDVSEVILNLNNHVSAVNDIYINTVFDDIRGINFFIRRIRVNGTAEQQDSSNPFRFDNLGVEKFLELNSLQDHSQYCLAYIFANRDFNDGVLGLAWVGSTGSASGGICEDFSSFSGVMQSLNTGVVTIQNYGSTVASKVSHITFAHELGHNFGSPHDYPLKCRPGDSVNGRADGNYIMYASATSGDKQFNDEFSECSIGNMTGVIRQNGGCFEESDMPICGNLIVEGAADNGKEECDCGYEDQCEDQCCNAANCELTSRNNVKVQCSPSQGPCCNSSCNFEGMASGKQCRPADDCSEASFCWCQVLVLDFYSCTDQQAACPRSVAKPDLTECNQHTQVCKSGECQESICVKFGLTECFCAELESTQLEEACHICCMGSNGTCQSSRHIPAMQAHVDMWGQDEELPDGTTVKVLYQMPGAPCNEYQGYCDVFYKCRNVDSNGPLSRLTNAILNPELYANIANWIQANWWAAVLIVLAVIIFMGLFIKICSVHTPSSNPNLPKARKVSVPGTLRRRQAPRDHQSIPMA